MKYPELKEVNDDESNKSLIANRAQMISDKTIKKIQKLSTILRETKVNPMQQHSEIVRTMLKRNMDTGDEESYKLIEDELKQNDVNAKTATLIEFSEYFFGLSSDERNALNHLSPDMLKLFDTYGYKNLDNFFQKFEKHPEPCLNGASTLFRRMLDVIAEAKNISKEVQDITLKEQHDRKTFR